MKKIKRVIALALIGILFLNITGCGLFSTESDSKSTGSGTLKTIRVGVPGLDDSPLLENGSLAKKLGFFDEELNAVGYKFELVTFQEAGPAINEAYASSRIDLAVYGDLPASVCKSNGVDIKIIGSANSQQNLAITVGKNSGIQTPKDLEGKRVIVGIGTNYHKYWQQLVETYKIDESKVELVNVVADGASVFAAGEADAWLTMYYSASFYESNGVGKIIQNTVDHKEMASQFLVTGRTEYLEENKAAAQAFLKALKRSQEYAVANPEELYEAVASPLIGVPSYEKAYNFDSQFKFLDPAITEDTISKLNYLSKFLKSQGFIKNDINLDEFIDTSYYENN